MLDAVWVKERFEEEQDQIWRTVGKLLEVFVNAVY